MLKSDADLGECLFSSRVQMCLVGVMPLLEVAALPGMSCSIV